MWHRVIWWYNCADVSEELNATSFSATPMYFYHIWRCYALADSKMQCQSHCENLKFSSDSSFSSTRCISLTSGPRNFAFECKTIADIFFMKIITGEMEREGGRRASCWCGPGERQVARSCECGNELSGSIKCGEFLDWLRNFSFSRKTLLDSAGRSVGTLSGWTVSRSVGWPNGYAFRKLTLLPPSGEWLLKHVYQLYVYFVS